MDHDFPYECRRIRQNKPPCWNNADELPIISGNVEIDDSLSNAFVAEPGEGLGDRFGFQQPYRIVAGDLPDNGVQVGKSVDIHFLEQVIAVGRRKLAPTDSTHRFRARALQLKLRPGPELSRSTIRSAAVTTVLACTQNPAFLHVFLIQAYY